MRTPFVTTLFGLSLVACAGQIEGGGPDIPESCGNGVMEVELGETCDDSNNVDGDGCSAACTREAPPRIDIAVDKLAVSTELGTTNMVTITAVGGNGFAGDVAVNAQLVDDLGVVIPGWTMTVNPPTLTLGVNGTANAVATFSIPTDNTQLTGKLKVTTTSSATEGVTAVDSAITVTNQVTIPMSLAGGQCTYPADGTLNVKQGTAVRWVNNELAGSGNNITIHIQPDGTSNFNHQSDPGSLPQGVYQQIAGAPGALITWYCHAPGPTVNGLKIQVVP
jgi:cysteine-rich repeat protein